MIKNNDKKERRKGPGRPPKNEISTISSHAGLLSGSRNPRKIGQYPLKAQHKTKFPNDGFNVRKEVPGEKNKETKAKTYIVKGIYAHPDTNQIFFEVDELGVLSMKSREWALQNCKQAVILYYESLVR